MLGTSMSSMLAYAAGLSLFVVMLSFSIVECSPDLC